MRWVRRRRGLALVLALWFVVLLTTMVYTTLWNVQVEVRLRRMAADSVEARWLAHAGVAKAVADLANDMVIDRSEDNVICDALGDVWSFDNEDKTDVALSERDGAGTFTVEVEDGESRINLNSASANLLRSLFIVLGEEDEAIATHRAAAIIDWRDQNTEPSAEALQSGYLVGDIPEAGFQETEFWREALLEETGETWEGIFHNDRFLTTEELVGVPGFNLALYLGAELQDGEDSRSSRRRRRRRGEEVASLRDCVTTLSNGNININTAPREVLGALALTALGSGAEWEDVADEIIEYRDGRKLDDTDDDTPFHSVGDLANVPIAAGLANGGGYTLTHQSRTFVITATGRAGSSRHTIVCEARRDWQGLTRPREDTLQSELMDEIVRGLMPAFDTSAGRRSSRGREGRRDDDTLSVEMPSVQILTWAEH